MPWPCQTTFNRSSRWWKRLMPCFVALQSKSGNLAPNLCMQAKVKGPRRSFKMFQWQTLRKGTMGTLVIPDFRNSNTLRMSEVEGPRSHAFLFWMRISACAKWNEFFFWSSAVRCCGFVWILYRVSEKRTWSWTRFRLAWPGTVEEIHKNFKSCKSCIRIVCIAKRLPAKKSNRIN